MPESVQSCFELSIHFPVFFSPRAMFRAVHGWFANRQMHGKFKPRLDAFWHSVLQNKTLVSDGRSVEFTKIKGRVNSRG